MRPTWLRTYTEASPEAFSRAMEQALDGVWAPHLEPTCLSEKTVIATLGDGSFIYGCPTSTLWAADAYGAPFLCVIYNNQLHRATKLHLKDAYPDSYSARTDNWVGMDMAPSVDFSMVAQSCRAYGEVVEDPGQVKPALERALEQVNGGRMTVLDVRIECP